MMYEYETECTHRPTENGGHTDMTQCQECSQIWQLRWVPVDNAIDVADYTQSAKHNNKWGGDIS